MENRRNMREEIKFEIEHKNIHKSAINSRIYRYINKKYKNILEEESFIKEILECCKEDDEEVKQEYLKVLEQLEQEKWKVFNQIHEMDNKEDMEK